MRNSYFKTALRTHGNYYYGSEFRASGGWELINKTYTTNPDTSNAWTWTEVQELEAGVGAKTTNALVMPGPRCTQVFVVVNENYSFAQNTSVTNGTYRQTNLNFSEDNTRYYWNVTVNDGYSMSFSDWYMFTTASSGVSYVDVIRNYGLDYMVWLGDNLSAFDVARCITGFDEATEYIATWSLSTWNNSCGLWNKYYGDATGTNFTITTFTIIQTYLDDAVGNQTITMTGVTGLDYNSSKNITWVNTTVNKGYNFSCYNKNSNTTLSDINTSIGLLEGEFVGVWNRSVFDWDYYLAFFDYMNYNVTYKDVIVSKVESTLYWLT